MSAPSPPIPLEYFSRAPNWWKRYSGPLLIAFVVAGITIAWHRWEAPVWRQICQLYWQHECLNYSPPSGLITYEAVGKDNSRLPVAGRGYLSDPDNGVPDGAIAAIPQCLVKFLSLNPRQFPCPMSPRILFAHRMQATSGASYLVILRADWICETDGPLVGIIWPFRHDFNIDCQIFRPATLVSPPIEVSGNVLWSKFEPEDDWRPLDLRFYAAQITSKDCSRFTIPYDFDGKRDYLDAHLDDRWKYPQMGGDNICLFLASRYASFVIQPGNYNY